MCSIDYDNYPELWRETERTARKAHRCDSCGGPIAPGSRYVDHFSKIDGEAYSEKLCADCKGARAEFCDAHGAGVCNPSYFPRLLSECVFDGDPESDTRWRPMLTALQARRGGRAHG